MPVIYYQIYFFYQVSPTYFGVLYTTPRENFLNRSQMKPIEILQYQHEHLLILCDVSPCYVVVLFS